MKHLLILSLLAITMAFGIMPESYAGPPTTPTEQAYTCDAPAPCDVVMYVYQAVPISLPVEVQSATPEATHVFAVTLPAPTAFIPEYLPSKWERWCGKFANSYRGIPQFYRHVDPGRGMDYATTAKPTTVATLHMPTRYVLRC